MTASAAADVQPSVKLRPLTWEGDVHLATTRPLIVTSSNPPPAAPPGGDRTTTPGVAVEGIDLDGVGRMLLALDGGGGAGCSGSLMGSGRHVLTAAHCVTPDGTNHLLAENTNSSVTFELDGGNLTVPFTSTAVSWHPMFDGSAVNGFDVAVIDLGTPVPASIPRYELNTDNAGVFEAGPLLAVGYGFSGDGATGDDSTNWPFGVKRAGLNNFESTGIGGIAQNTETQLTADFDSGEVGNDAFDFFFGLGSGLANLGFGDDEVGTAPGDSGGPSFVLDGGVPKLVGVHSYGLRIPDIDVLGNSDVDGALNASWGEFWVDARVAHPDVLSWIQTVAIPEPSSAVLVMCAALGMLVTRRR